MAKKLQKNAAQFSENPKNHGKITAAYIAAKLLKTKVSNYRKIYSHSKQKYILR